MVHDITLFASTTEDFSTNGLGTLAEAIRCEVTEEANGAFELEMEYPVWGKRYNDLIARNFIVCKSNPFSSPQIFRIYSISRPMDGIVTYNAQHISYDLSCHPLLPFKASSCAAAIDGLKRNSLTNHRFTFWTDKNNSGDFGYDVPMSIRSALGGTEGSILDIYGGDYEFDNFEVKLHNKRGVDRGFTIRYGKNLTDFSQEESIDKVYTSVYPYWTGRDEEGNDIYTELPDRLVSVDTPYNFTNVLILDASSEFDEEPTSEELTAYTKAYIADNNIGEPSINFNISFFQLSQALEYKDRTLLDQIELFDTVTVQFDMMLGKTAKAKVVATTYDAITDRYESITLGSVQASISDTVGGVSQAIQSSEKRSNSHMDLAIQNATWWITNGKGYMVAVKDDAGNWKEICSLDEPSIETAKHVWRWNNGGFGYSGTGYNGPYTTAITQDGHIVANFIDTGTLTATIIKSGILAPVDGDCFFLDLDHGILRMNATELKIVGVPIQDTIDESSKADREYADSKASELALSAKNYAEEILEQYGLEANETLKNAIAAATTQKAIFDSLTNGGELKGLFMKDGELYINASYLSTGILQSKDGETFFLDLDNGILNMKANIFTVSGKTIQEIAETEANNAVNSQTQLDIYNKLTNNKSNSGLYLINGKLYINANYINTGILESKDGETFYLDLDNGVLKMHASELVIDGNNVNNALANSVTSIVQQFYLSNYSTSLSGGYWSNNQPTWTQGKFIWNRQYVTYGNGQNAYLPSETGVCITGNTGSNGTNGTNGVGVSSVVAEYATSSSTTYAPSSGYSTTMPTVSKSEYIWCRQKVTYTNGSVNYTSAYCMSKTMGDIAQQKVDAQTQQEIFNKLTNNGSLKGIYMENGELYINASYLNSGYLSANRIQGGTLILGTNGGTVGSLVIYDNTGTQIGSWSSSGIRATQGTIGPWTINNKAIFNGIEYKGNKDSNSTGMGPYGSNWAFWAGDGRFSVKQDGTLYASSGTFTGDISGASGTFTGKIKSNGAYGSAGVEEGLIKVFYNNTKYGEYGITGNSLTSFTYGKTVGTGSSSTTVYSTATMLRFTTNTSGALFVFGSSIYMDFMSGYVISCHTNFNIGGDLSVTGQKHRISNTENYQERLLYCYETSSPLFGDIGEAVTDENGECYLFLDDVFTETVSTEIEYQVFLQKEGPGDIWISEKTPKYFVVKGTPNLKFAWEIKAKQKSYEYERLEKFSNARDNEINYEDDYIDEYNSLIENEEAIFT